MVVRSHRPAPVPCRLRAADPLALRVALQGLVLDVGAGTLAVYANDDHLPASQAASFLLSSSFSSLSLAT